eukprot:Awhi_evm1s6351
MKAQITTLLLLLVQMIHAISVGKAPVTPGVCLLNPDLNPKDDGSATVFCAGVPEYICRIYASCLWKSESVAAGEVALCTAREGFSHHNGFCAGHILKNICEEFFVCQWDKRVTLCAFVSVRKKSIPCLPCFALLQSVTRPAKFFAKFWTEISCKESTFEGF